MKALAILLFSALASCSSLQVLTPNQAANGSLIAGAIFDLAVDPAK